MFAVSLLFDGIDQGIQSIFGVSADIQPRKFAVAETQDGLQVQQSGKEFLGRIQVALAAQLACVVHAEYDFGGGLQSFEVRHDVGGGKAQVQQFQRFECEKAFGHAGRAGIDDVNGNLARHFHRHFADDVGRAADFAA